MSKMSALVASIFCSSLAIAQGALPKKDAGSPRDVAAAVDASSKVDSTATTEVESPPVKRVLNSRVEVCFTPKQPCERRIMDIIDEHIKDGKKHHIRVSVYFFTNKTLMAKLNEFASARDTNTVSMIVDKSCSLVARQYCLEEGLGKVNPAFVPVLAKGAISHNKYMIIDDDLVITGSANYTDTAFKRNLENVVIIRSKKIAAQYISNFDTLSKSQPK